MAVAALLAAQPLLAATVVVQGSVANFGVEGPPKGLGGVTVIIKERSSQRELATTNTHPDGSYVVAVDIKSVDEVTLWFDKLGYVQRNAQRPLSDPAKPQSVVYLLSEDAPAGGTAANIVQYGNSGADSRLDTLFSAVSSLPSTKRDVVLSELKLKDPRLYSEFSMSDLAFQSAAVFNAKVKRRGTDDPSAFISVYPNFGATGTMRVYGSVANAETKRKVEGVVKSLGKNQSVQNDIVINKDSAITSKQLDKILRESGG
jgi:hypothetical protein